MPTRSVDIAVALAFLALSTIVFAGTWDLAYWSDFAPGPAFAPIWFAATGAVLALLLLFQTLRDPTPRPADLPSRPALLRVLLTIAALCVALAVAQPLGFVTAVAALTLFVLLV